MILVGDGDNRPDDKPITYAQWQIDQALGRIKGSDPNTGHRFVIQASSLGSTRVVCICDPDERRKSGCSCLAAEGHRDSNWMGDPSTIAVRAWSLKDALTVALTQSFADWVHPGAELDSMEDDSSDNGDDNVTEVEFDTDLRYVAQENDVIGGYCVTLGPWPPSDGNREVACFAQEPMAELIAEAFNAKLDNDPDFRAKSRTTLEETRLRIIRLRMRDLNASSEESHERA